MNNEEVIAQWHCRFLELVPRPVPDPDVEGLQTRRGQESQLDLKCHHSHVPGHRIQSMDARYLLQVRR